MTRNSNSRGYRKWRALVVFAAIMHCGVAHAHVRSESFSRWHIDEQTVSVTFTVSAREATRIPAAPHLSSLSTTVARYLADQIIIHTQSDGCQSSRTFTPSRSRSGYIQVEAAWRCNTKPESLEIRAFFDLAPEHVHFVTLRTSGHLEQRMLTEKNPIWQLRPGESTQPVTADSPTGFWSYVRLGITHISTGYDHIAFLLALLLICRRPRDIVLAVSGFTIGHSITLALGVMGMLRPNTLAIEATIGLTIALVAMEHASLNRRSAVVLASLTGSLLLGMAALSTRQVGQLSTQVFTGLAVFSFCYLLLSHDLQGRGSLRVLMTVLFGLIHGVGFAGAFINNELPSELLAPLLFGFNIGVEIGQLAVIALILLVFLLLRRRYSTRTFVRLDEVFAAGLCGLGIFLLVHRTYGPVTIG